MSKKIEWTELFESGAPIDAVRLGLREAFKIAATNGDAAAATIAKVLLEVETERKNQNDAVAPIEKDGTYYCATCGQKQLVPSSDGDVTFEIHYGGLDKQKKSKDEKVLSGESEEGHR